MIMLSLATREPYFLVLRDVLDFKRAEKPSVDHCNNAPVSTPASPKVRNIQLQTHQRAP